jgi:hypothetical protein
MMVYTEAIGEMIEGNTQGYIDELQDIKNAIEMLNERAADNTREKVNSLYEKIYNWDSDHKANDLARWLNELHELENDIKVFESELPKSCMIVTLWHHDLYYLLDSILEIYACDINGNILLKDDSGKFYVDSKESLGEKHLTLEDKRVLAYQLIEKMPDKQLNEVIKAKLCEKD